MKIIRSPLRYPGGKRWLFSEVYQYIPDGADVVSPFFGGGAIEINCALRGHRVYGYDLFEPLVNFWQHYLDDPKAVIDKAKGILLTNGREHFQYMQKEGFEKLKKPLDKGVYYYLLNKVSFGGMPFIPYPGVRENYLTSLSPRILSEARDFSVKGVSVENKNVFDVLQLHNQFTYLDPPYDLKRNLYGDSKDFHIAFDHEKLANILNNRDNWILSYNDTPYIRQLYEDCDILEVKKPIFGKWNASNYELLVFSHDITPIPTPVQQSLLDVI